MTPDALELVERVEARERLQRGCGISVRILDALVRAGYRDPAALKADLKKKPASYFRRLPGIGTGVYRELLKWAGVDTREKLVMSVSIKVPVDDMAQAFGIPPDNPGAIRVRLERELYDSIIKAKQRIRHE